MNKIRYLWRDFFHYFFSIRLLIFCIFQLYILHYYIHSVKQFSIIANYPASPWILPFMGQNTYFLFLYGISVIYFYSNIPFTQKHEMYVLLRQGRTLWTCTKLFRIWSAALSLTLIEWFISILLLFPRLEWTFQWGKLYNSLAMTNAGSKYHVAIPFSYEIINEANALKTSILFFIVMFLVTGIVGMIMFTLSIYFNRIVAVLIGTCFSVLTVVFANLYLYQEWISFISPFSWLNLLLLYGRVCPHAPSFSLVIFITILLLLLLCPITLKRMQSINLVWTKEE